MEIVVTGSIAFDYIMSFPGNFSEHLLKDQLHTVSVSFLVDSLRRERGGVAPNIAYTMALLGGRPKIMAAAGRDFDSYGRWLAQQGVDISTIKIIKDEYCASFFVNTDQVQNQIGHFYPGAMAHSDQLSFQKLTPGADLAIISPNDPAAMRSYVREAGQLGLSYIFDPSQQTIRLSAEDLVEGLTGSYMLTVNEYELEMIKGKTGLSLDSMLELTGGLLLTLGKKGSIIYRGGSVYEIPAVAPEMIGEPTGAGDAFRGGLLRAIQLGLSWDVAGRVGALAATYVLENFGTQGHSYTAAEFVARFRENFDDHGALDALTNPQ